MGKNKVKKESQKRHFKKRSRKRYEKDVKKRDIKESKNATARKIKKI
jgi:hypothetical protein